MNLIKISTYLVIILPTLFLGIVLGFYLIQDYMIFLGEKLPEEHEYNFPQDYEELYFTTKDGLKLNALLFKTENSRGLVYYHHGNAGNLQGWGNYANNFLSLGFDVLFYDYRGYGKSEGRIKKGHQLLDDALSILKEIETKYEDKTIIYYGISLGSGIAAKLAKKKAPNALVLETPYFNFCELVHYHYPYLPSKIMSKYKLRTDKNIKEILCPILIIHGTDDKIVPFDHGLRLSQLKEEIRFVKVEGGVHSNLTDFNIYHSELKTFLSDL